MTTKKGNRGEPDREVEEMVESETCGKDLEREDNGEVKRKENMLNTVHAVEGRTDIEGRRCH